MISITTECMTGVLSLYPAVLGTVIGIEKYKSEEFGLGMSIIGLGHLCSAYFLLERGLRRGSLYFLERKIGQLFILSGSAAFISAIYFGISQYAASFLYFDRQTDITQRTENRFFNCSAVQEKLSGSNWKPRLLVSFFADKSSILPYSGTTISKIGTSDDFLSDMVRLVVGRSHIRSIGEIGMDKLRESVQTDLINLYRRCSESWNINTFSLPLSEDILEYVGI